MHLDLSCLMAGCPFPPQFCRYRYLDENPLSGNVKNRTLFAPNRPMKRVHAAIIAYLRSAVPFSPWATGSVPGESTLRNAKRHAANRHFLLYDVKDAYESVDLERLLLCLANYDASLATPDGYLAMQRILELFCMAPEGGLMTGAPASPDLFNLYAMELLDRPLGAYCSKHGITYSRYLDDLTFSSLSPIGPRHGRKKRQGIRKIIEASGMEIHQKKSRGHDLEKTPIEINGIGIGRGGRLFVPRGFMRRARTVLYRGLNYDTASYDLVSGLMGVVLQATPRDHTANKFERKLLNLYYRWRRMHGKENE